MPRHRDFFPLRPPDRIRFFPLGEEGVLFLEGSRNLWHLNYTATFIWKNSAETENEEELARLLSQHFPVSLSQARKDTRDTLAFFQNIFRFRPAPSARDNVAEKPRPSSRTTLFSSSEKHRCIEEEFVILGHRLYFSSMDRQTGEAFTSLLYHFHSSTNPTADRNGNQTKTVLAVTPSSGGCTNIFLNGKLFSSNNSPDTVLPQLQMIVYNMVIEKLEGKLLFHGATLVKSKKSLLLLADSGSGKTTLAAVLCTKGFTYYGDELAVVCGRPPVVTPLPLPMSIKQGALSVLERYFPSLSSYAVHDRLDGKKVRYLLPSQDSLAGDEETPVGYLVFPQYDPGKQIILRILSQAETLQGLAKTASFDRPLVPDDIETMIAMVQQAPGFALHFSNVEDAIIEIENLMDISTGQKRRTPKG